MSSSTQIPRLRPCPKCVQTGVVEDAAGAWATCPLCHGDKYVSHFRAAQYELERHDTEPEMKAVKP